MPWGSTPAAAMAAFPGVTCIGWLVPVDCIPGTAAPMQGARQSVAYAAAAGRLAAHS